MGRPNQPQLRDADTPQCRSEAVGPGFASRRAVTLLATLAVSISCGTQSRELGSLISPVLVPQESGTRARLQALSVVNAEVVWASGAEGTYSRTLDGGATWRSAVVPGADSLQFRDVHAFDADRAVLLAAGPGELSRIYRTVDAGVNWDLVFRNQEPDGFYDCLDFWSETEGAAYGDAVDGGLRILTTSDGGRTWSLLPPASLPPALEGEGGFAASGTCLVAGPGRTGWIGTGNAARARVLRTDDGGAHWTVHDTPLVAGEGAGIFSVVFSDNRRVMVLGGDLGRRDENTDNVAVSLDGGRSWRVAGRTRMPGAVYGAAWVPAAGSAAVVAVGPGGVDLSTDWGQSWTGLSDQEFWAVAFESPRASWLVGPQGRIVHMQLR